MSANDNSRKDDILNTKMRKAIYAIATVVNVLTAYLLAIGEFGTAEVTLVNGLTAAVLIMAGLNVPKTN